MGIVALAVFLDVSNARTSKIVHCAEMDTMNNSQGVIIAHLLVLLVLLLRFVHNAYLAIIFL